MSKKSTGVYMGDILNSRYDPYAELPSRYSLSPSMSPFAAPTVPKSPRRRKRLLSPSSPLVRRSPTPKNETSVERRRRMNKNSARIYRTRSNTNHANLTSRRSPTPQRETVVQKRKRMNKNSARKSRLKRAGGSPTLK